MSPRALALELGLQVAGGGALYFVGRLIPRDEVAEFLLVGFSLLCASRWLGKALR